MGEYPHIQFQKRWQIPPDTQYQLGQCDAIILAISNMPLMPEYHETLLGISLIKGAQATTAIEGNTLSDEDVALVAKGQSLPPSKEYQEIEVRNILDAFNTLLREVAVDGRTERVTPDLIRRFHRMIGQGLGEHFDAMPGQFRTDRRIVGSYRTPDHEDVPSLVQQLCDWLVREFHFESGQTFADAVVQAIVVHVYIEWIHPFGDGNGRTGRLLEFYLLMRAGNPDIASHILSNFYNETRAEYYRQLERATATRDLTSFIQYAAQGLRDGLLKTLETLQASHFEMAWRNLIHTRFAEKKYHKRTIFKRQRDLILELPTGRTMSAEQIALITPRIARSYGNLSLRTLKRDLSILEDMGLVVRIEDRYRANSDVLRSQVARRRRNR